MFSAKDAASSLVPLSANAALAAAIIPGLVTAIASIDDGTKGYGTLADGQRIDFDYAIIATGSAYGAWKAPATSGSTKAARQATLGSCYAAMEVADDIIVVGGGPVGVEAAAAAAETFPGKKVTVVVGGERLMDKFEQQVSDIAAKWLKEHGVTLLYGERVQGTEREHLAPELESQPVGIATERERIVWRKVVITNPFSHDIPMLYFLCFSCRLGWCGRYTFHRYHHH